MPETGAPGAPSLTGLIFEVQRFSIHDGPGIRTTVFMKGCPLRCAWCHNPEGLDPQPQISFQADKCIGCGYCFRTCPRDAHRMVDGGHDLARAECERCGSCTQECWAGALEHVGRQVSVADVLTQVLRDRPFYDTSGGGMTLSGGEPMSQIEFTLALLHAAAAAGIHCCMETCGLAPAAAFERVLPHVDLFLFDIKDTDDARHRAATGVSNALILANLRMLHDAGAQVRLRLPLIPGYNDRDDHFEGIAALVGTLANLTGVQIMPYHPLGRDKYGPLGLTPNTDLPTASVDQDTLGRWIDKFRSLGVTVI